MGHDEDRVRTQLARLLEEHPPSRTDPVEFWQAQFDLGLAWVDFPADCGGLGVSPLLQEVVLQTLLDAGAPSNFARNPIGVGMAGPTIVRHGTDDQRARFLRPLFAGEEIWCQLFSEPGAGSDLAGLSTRAVRDGDHWVVNGQKVWTTLAHQARWGLLLARTDPSELKHRGLSYFILDMQAEGVDVRPLRQLTGDAEFNEVYLTDVRLRDADRLGDIGEGWAVALTTLMNERSSLGGAEVSLAGAPPVTTALGLWRDRALDDPVLRDRLLQIWIDGQSLEALTERAAAQRRDGQPGPEGSIAKLVLAESTQRAFEWALDALGSDAVLFPGGYESGPHIGDDGTVDPRWAFLRSRANTIEGGTTEVMLNILGERILGLPGDLRADRDRAWSEIPRN